MTTTEDTQTYANDSATSSPINTGLTQPRSGFDLEDTRRGLIAKRVRYGSNSPKGHACSNLVEQLQAMATYVRPAWAVHESQTLPWMIAQQMKRLALRDSTDRNIDELSLARLREVLDYNPETGALTWRFRLSPNCKLGEPAGQIGVHGYRKIRIDGRYYPASHLAWFHYYGTPPSRLVDHKDRDKSNDRIENLRLATHSQNCQNQKRNARNTTGFKGVAVFNQPGEPTRYRALIRVNGERLFLGIFDTIAEAHEIYRTAAEKYHGEFAQTV